MFKIKGYNLQSVTVGTRHVRTFSVNDKQGLITDFVLGECGANNSPLPKDYYEIVNIGDGIQLQDDERTRSFLVNKDRIVLSEKTDKISEDILSLDAIYEKAKYLIPKTYTFLDNPKGIFLGMVLQFAEQDLSERNRYNHPVAELLNEKLLKFSFESKEYPCETNVHLSYRKKTSRGFLMRGVDDYFNIILNIGDTDVNDVWKNTEPKVKDVKSEKTRISLITVDIQIVFDPRRTITEKAFDAHLDESQRHSQRISSILEGVGFGKD